MFQKRDSKHMNRLLWLTTVCLLSVFSIAASATTIKRGGYEWVQMSDYTDLSWVDINNNCSNEGVCSGEVNGHDLDGLTWASTDDVLNLFETYVSFPEPELNSFEFIVRESGTWASAFFEDFFATDIQSTHLTLTALVRSYGSILPDQADAFIVQDVFDSISYDSIAFAERSRYAGSEYIGHWLYKTPNKIPSPSSIFLMLFGFVLVLHRLNVARNRT